MNESGSEEFEAAGHGGGDPGAPARGRPAAAAKNE